MYDFSKLPGDSFYTHIPDDSTQIAVVHVLDTADTVMNGYTLPMIKMSCIVNNVYPVFNGWAILNLGRINGDFFPYPIGTDVPTRDLRCYHDTLLGEQDFKIPCDTSFTVGIKNIQSPFVQTKNFPNPDNGSFTLKYLFNESKSGIFQVFNLQGKMIFKRWTYRTIG